MLAKSSPFFTNRCPSRITLDLPKFHGGILFVRQTSSTGQFSKIRKGGACNNMAFALRGGGGIQYTKLLGRLRNFRLWVDQSKKSSFLHFLILKFSPSKKGSFLGFPSIYMGPPLGNLICQWTVVTLTTTWCFEYPTSVFCNFLLSDHFSCTNSPFNSYIIFSYCLYFSPDFFHFNCASTKYGW